MTKGCRSGLYGRDNQTPYPPKATFLALLTRRDAADLLDTQRSEHLRSMRVLTDRKRKGDLADQLICDHARFRLEAALRWLELTAARLDKLREAVAR
ncbi:hypothetical protein SALBM217S_08039 [Streptomyces griseoloalbus]